NFESLSLQTPCCTGYMWYFINVPDNMQAVSYAVRAGARPAATNAQTFWSYLRKSIIILPKLLVFLV
ncbi:MAG: hypothetical protein ABIN89_15775, partial [Chitinophagaceae bacterium]